MERNCGATGIGNDKARNHPDGDDDRGRDHQEHAEHEPVRVVRQPQRDVRKRDATHYGSDRQDHKSVDLGRL